MLLLLPLSLEGEPFGFTGVTIKMAVCENLREQQGFRLCVRGDTKAILFHNSLVYCAVAMGSVIYTGRIVLTHTVGWI